MESSEVFFLFLIFGDITPALLWVETKSNIADYPLRFVELPPHQLQDLGVDNRMRFVGWEFFAGSARLTQARIQAGLHRYGPIEILLGNTAFDPQMDMMIRAKRVAWLWQAPPCSS